MKIHRPVWVDFSYADLMTTKLLLVK